MSRVALSRGESGRRAHCRLISFCCSGGTMRLGQPTHVTSRRRMWVYASFLEDGPSIVSTFVAAMRPGSQVWGERMGWGGGGVAVLLVAGYT